MKSKISCFSKIVFRKNIALYWPIWVVYLLGLLIMPVRLWVDLAEEAQGVYENSNNILFSGKIVREYEYLCSALEMEGYIIFVFFMAILTATALFSYLYSFKSCQMIHAFPVTRRELYITNVMSGFCFMLIPELLAFVIAVIVCLAYGVTCVQYIAIWLLFMVGISVIAYAMAVFCCMLTGQIFAGAVYFGILNFLCPAAQFLFFLAASSVGSGIGIDMNNYHYNKWLSPFICLLDTVDFSTEGYADGMPSIHVDGSDAIAYYLIPAILFFVVAFVLYGRRQLEDTGNLVTVPFLKPVFRWGCGTMFGYAASLTLTPILFLVLPNYFVILIVLLVGVGCICFFLAQMLLKKSFRVFNRRSIVECMVFVVVLLASFGIMRGSVWIAARQIPERSDIKQVCVIRSYPIWYSGRDIQKVLDWHEQIIEHLGEIEEISRQNDFYNYSNIEITYLLNDGSAMIRQYYLPYEREPYYSMNMELYQKECETETFLNNYLNDTSFVYTKEGYEVYYTNCDYRELEAKEGCLRFFQQNGMHSVDFTGAKAQALYEAVISDAQTGNLQKYNIISADGTRADENLFSEVELELKFDHMFEKSSLSTGEMAYSYQSIYLQFGNDCTNIIQTLLDYGIISSIEELEEE